MQQTNAAERSADHLRAAIKAIDAALGEGYAAKNPALVAAFLQSASIENAVLSGDAATQRVDATVREAVAQLCKSLERLKPRFL